MLVHLFDAGHLIASMHLIFLTSLIYSIIPSGLPSRNRVLVPTINTHALILSSYCFHKTILYFSRTPTSCLQPQCTYLLLT